MSLSRAYRSLLLERSPAADENYTLAVQKKQAAHAFVRAFLAEEECFDRLVAVWRKRQARSSSLAVFAEEYGDTSLSAQVLGDRINNCFESALREPRLRLTHMLEASIAFQRYTSLFQDGGFSLPVADRLTPLYDEYLQIRNELIVNNLKLVPGFVKGYLGRGIDFLDLLQHGNLGLIRAIDKFDPDKETTISTYANWWVRRYLSDLIKDTRRTVRVPRHVPAVVEKIARFQQQWERDNGAPPTPEEIQTEFPALTEWKQFLLDTALLDVLPLDTLMTPPGEARDRRGSSVEQNLATPDVDHVHQLDTYVMAEQIKSRMPKVLSRQEQIVIQMRFGLEPYYPSSLRDIAEHLNVSSADVKKMELAALEKLRQGTRNDG